MELEASIIAQFKELGISLEQNVIQHCKEICTGHTMDARAFVETWLSYSFTFLDGAKPTIESLEKMEKSALHENVTTPKRSSRKEMHKKLYSTRRSNMTPMVLKECETDLIDSNQHLNSPSLTSPCTSTKGNSGDIMIFLGKSKEFCNGSKIVNPEIKFLNCPQDRANPRSRFMDVHLLDRNVLMLDAHESTARLILARNNLEIKDSKDSVIAGRIISCAMATHLLTVEGLLQWKEKIMTVDIREMNEFSFIPGQVIVFDAKQEGQLLKMKTLHNTPVSPHSFTFSKSEPLQIALACGPLTHIDNLSNSPFKTLLENLHYNQANVLIIIGPLIDISNTRLRPSEVQRLGNLYYKDLFERIVDDIKGTNKTVFYVCSSKECDGIPVYPTTATRDVLDPCLKFVPDPCMIDIDGVVIAVTATDVLMHMGRNCISSGKNRLMKLASHILQQQNLYPLYPSASDIVMDPFLWHDLCLMSVIPHILVLPSDLQPFLKIIEGCLVVNPNRVMKGCAAAGTFCVIEVRPKMDSEVWSPENNMAAKIIRL